MLLISRYIFNEYFKVFLATAAALVLVIFSIDFLEMIRHFYQFQPSFYYLASYFLLRIPKIFFEMMPLAVLLSTLITFGTLSKHNEITAFKSAGISVSRLALPLFVFGIVVSFISFYLGRTLIPKAYKAASSIRTVQIEKRKPSGGFVQNKTWLNLDHRRLIYVELITPDKTRMEGIHLYTLDRTFSLVEEDEAKALVYEGGEWVLLEGVNRTFFKDGNFKVTPFERKKIALKKVPEDFQRVRLKVKETTHRELQQYIQQLSDDGLNPVRYQVDLRGKEALSFANFIMVFLGIPFALKNSRSAGITWGVVISLGVALFYWLVFSVSLSLGRLMIFPPWLAAWSANILLSIIGAYLFLSVRQ
ncbi:LPS export ABC transporter permease LptG [Nitrospira defluvii]|nr:LPS export ABC transporter permease LptG [Nitrospira defluvii]